jgi:hypothetical protein
VKEKREANAFIGKECIIFNCKESATKKQRVQIRQAAGSSYIS